MPEEIPNSAGDINYLPSTAMDSQGAFHEKSEKNKKVTVHILNGKHDLLRRKKPKERKKRK